MKYQNLIWTLGIFAGLMIGLLFVSPTHALAQTADPYGDSGVEVLTRGPVHEAFAEPVTFNPTQGIVVTTDIPAPIEEIPPEDIPEGDNVQWVSGYWNWDTDRNDFIWISGIWRDPPPDRSWVPGYWTPVAEGWLWTPGFWTSAESDEVEYLPRPPESLEVGPSSPAPAPDRLWAPGSWFWINTRYAWRPGYWVSASPDWVWVPERYVWTPRGYIYVDGYWDRTLERRGVIFAPLYVQRSVYMQRSYVYTPTIVIQTGFLTAALFGSPDSHHYYFGDYYGEEYSRRGYRPWFEVDIHHRGYDPIYAHQRWQHARTDRHWERNVREEYSYRQQHVESRPSRTYSTQALVAARAPEERRRNLIIAAPISEVSKRRDTPVRFEKIDVARRETIGGNTKEVSKFRDARVKWESDQRNLIGGQKTNPKSDVRDKNKPIMSQPKIVQPQQPPKERVRNSNEVPEARIKAPKPSHEPEISKPEKVKIPKSPLMGKPAKDSGKIVKPPVRPDMPKIEPNVRPKETIQRREAPSKFEDKDKSKDKAPDPRNAELTDGKDKDKDNRDKSEDKNRGKSEDMKRDR